MKNGLKELRTMGTTRCKLTEPSLTLPTAVVSPSIAKAERWVAARRRATDSLSPYPLTNSAGVDSYKIRSTPRIRTSQGKRRL
jgi:hypothetical protein